MSEPGTPQFNTGDRVPMPPEQKKALITELQNILVKAMSDINFRAFQPARENIARMIDGELLTREDVLTPELGERIGRENGKVLADRLTYEAMGMNFGDPPFEKVCKEFNIPPSSVNAAVTRAARDLVFDTSTWGSDQCKEKAKKLLAEYGIPEDVLNEDNQ